MVKSCDRSLVSGAARVMVCARALTWSTQAETEGARALDREKTYSVLEASKFIVDSSFSESGNEDSH